MKRVSSAGAAPASITQRQESRRTSKAVPNAPSSPKPKFAAAPIAPASSGRSRSGQHSITNATPSDHSPPIPSAARKRNKPNCQAACAQ